MKLKNYYAWLLPFWIISTLLDSISCVVNFVEGNLAVGFIFIVLAVSFAFVSGILFEKALAIHKHNKTCDWLHEIAKELMEEELVPFKEFENKGELKND
jgi:hypothetical protein